MAFPLEYLVKSCSLLVLFSAVYYLLLRKETFFTANRFFLLASLVLSGILPLVSFTRIHWVSPVAENPLVLVASHPTAQPAFLPEQSAGFEIHWEWVLMVGYLLGVLFFLGQFLLDYLAVRKVLSSQPIRRDGNFKILETADDLPPFSYFRYIVYNPALYSEKELADILEHEKTHCRQWHSLDVLLARIFCIAFWCNPVAWLHKSMIVQNLEFIADKEASQRIASRKNYQITLLKVTAHEHCLAFTNPFYQSLIKKRIVMLNKNQSKKRNLWKYGIVLPALTAFMLQFQINVVAQEKAAAAKPEVTSVAFSVHVTSQNTDEDLNHGIKEIASSYGIDLVFSDLKRNDLGHLVNLTAVAKSKEGKVRKFTTQAGDGGEIQPFSFFVSNPEGKNKDFGFENETGAAPKATAATSENVPPKAIPKKQPTQNTFSTTFNDDSEKEVHTYALGPYTKTVSTEKYDLRQKKNFLVIINGKEYFYDDLKDSKISTKGTFTVLTKEEAAKYGEKGKDGVFVFSGDDTVITKEQPQSDTKIINTNDGDVVIYETNKMKVPGRASITFDQNSPELIIDGVKQENPEATLKKIDVMKIEHIDVNTKSDGSRQVIITTK